MGFTITSQITLLNLQATNLYVTVSGGYKIVKVGSDVAPVYMISAPYRISAAKGLNALVKGITIISVSAVPDNVYLALYNELKGKFPDATFVDN
jgi:hypothetical protein